MRGRVECSLARKRRRKAGVCVCAFFSPSLLTCNCTVPYGYELDVLCSYRLRTPPDAAGVLMASTRSWLVHRRLQLLRNEKWILSRKHDCSEGYAGNGWRRYRTVAQHLFYLHLDAICAWTHGDLGLQGRRVSGPTGRADRAPSSREVSLVNTTTYPFEREGGHGQSCSRGACSCIAAAKAW